MDVAVHDTDGTTNRRYGDKIQRGTRIVKHFHPAKTSRPPIDDDALQHGYADMMSDRPFKMQTELARHTDSSIDSVVEKQDHTMSGPLHPLRTHMSGRTG